MLSKRVFSSLKKRPQLLRTFGGGHHHKEYDWRDDPKYNPDLVQNPRHKGWDRDAMEFPYQGHDKWYWRFPVADYDKSDLTLIAKPENAKFRYDTSMLVNHNFILIVIMVGYQTRYSS